jgi:hypothetical protein
MRKVLALASPRCCRYVKLGNWLEQVSPSMLIELRMPALSPTMEEGTLAKWLGEAG